LLGIWAAASKGKLFRSKGLLKRGLCSRQRNRAFECFSMDRPLSAPFPSSSIRLRRVTHSHRSALDDSLALGGESCRSFNRNAARRNHGDVRRNPYRHICENEPFCSNSSTSVLPSTRSPFGAVRPEAESTAYGFSVRWGQVRVSKSRSQTRFCPSTGVQQSSSPCPPCASGSSHCLHVPGCV
jgi:hypothetical protein